MCSGGGRGGEGYGEQPRCGGCGVWTWVEGHEESGGEEGVGVAALAKGATKGVRWVMSVVGIEIGWRVLGSRKGGG